MTNKDGKQKNKLQKSTEEWWSTQLSRDTQYMTSIYPLLKPHWKDSASDSVTLPKGFASNQPQNDWHADFGW